MKTTIFELKEGLAYAMNNLEKFEGFPAERTDDEYSWQKEKKCWIDIVYKLEQRIKQEIETLTKN